MLRFRYDLSSEGSLPKITSLYRPFLGRLHAHPEQDDLTTFIETFDGWILADSHTNASYRLSSLWCLTQSSSETNPQQSCPHGNCSEERSRARPTGTPWQSGVEQSQGSVLVATRRVGSAAVHSFADLYRQAAAASAWPQKHKIVDVHAHAMQATKMQPFLWGGVSLSRS